jgi:pilus assembly protein Flp/PilA
VRLSPVAWFYDPSRLLHHVSQAANPLWEGEVVKAIQTFFRDDEAATAVEYAVMLAMIIVTCLAAISSFGGAQNGMWGGINSKLNNAGF